MIDASSTLTITDIRARPQTAFATSEQRQTNLGFTTATLWLKTRMPAELTDAPHPVLVVPIPILDDIAVYIRDRDDDITLYGGDRSTFDSRPLKRRVYVFPLPRAYEHEIVIRIRSDTALRFNAQFMDQITLEQREAQVILVRGFFYGLMVALFFCNLFLFVADRDISRTYYLCWLLTAVALASVIDGVPGYVGGPVWWPSYANEIGALLGQDRKSVV